MFEIHLIVFLDLINIYTDTKTIKIEAFIANLQAHPVFREAILNFEFLAGKPRATIWFPLFLNSAYSKNPRCKFSCFYPEVHDMAEKCHISAPLFSQSIIFQTKTGLLGKDKIKTISIYIIMNAVLHKSI